MALGVDGSVALSGYHLGIKWTFIDVLYFDPDCAKNCNIVFTQEFPKSANVYDRYGRFVSYFTNKQIVTCSNDTIKCIDVIKNYTIQSQTFWGQAVSMAVSEDRDKQIFVGLYKPIKVIVFSSRLTELKTITLTGLLDSRYVDELGVMGAEHTLCVRTTLPSNKALVYNINGVVQAEPLTAMNETRAVSIAVSSELLMVLWDGGTLISAHHIPAVIEGGPDSSLADRDGGHHIVAYFKIEETTTIRIKGNRLVSVNCKTGEVKEYGVEDIFSLPALLPALSSTINQDEVTKLASYFTITPDQSITDIQTLVQHLTNDDSTTPQNIVQLISACRDLDLQDAAQILSIYQEKNGFLSSEEELREKLLALEDEKFNTTTSLEMREMSLEGSRASLEKELKLTNHALQDLKSLREKLTTTKQSLTKSGAMSKEELHALNTRLTEELGQTKAALEKAFKNLHHSELKSAQETKALNEVLKQTKQASGGKANTDSDVMQASNDDRKADLTAIAGFGRLLVTVDEHLTLDNSLKLAMLFQLPSSKVDLLKRVSLVETPGSQLLDILKERDIINMYDVTNLQKALIGIRLRKMNDSLLEPYQRSVSKHLFEEHQTKELLSWPEVGEEQTTDDEEEHENTEGGNSVVAGKPIQRYRNPSLEQRIGTEGGTISVAGVKLSVPGNALTENRVIAVEVVRDADMELPGEDNRSRITPLIKLGPLKLEFEKPVTVTIPHCAVITDVDHHSVIVYSGQQSGEENKKGVTWTEERPASQKLAEESVEVSLTCLSFLTISLVSEEIVRRHVLRVVSFVGGITTPEEDIIIICCLCKDNDEDLKSLTEDHKSMLRLGNDATHMIERSSKWSDVSEAELEMSLELNKDSAYFIPEESRMQFDIDHACEAYRVSQRFRLQRKKEVYGDTTILEAKLTVSHGDTSTESLLQTKVRSLFMSAESKEFLRKKPDVKPYEDLKACIASQLNKNHCGKLCMHFGFASVVRESILDAGYSGLELMKILDERELIMPTKMIALYEGLTACSLNEIARKITEYTAALNGTKKQSKQEQKTVTTKPSKVEILTKEGFKETNVIQALKLSQGQVNLGQKILQVIAGHKERSQAQEPRLLYREQYLSELGGDLTLLEAGITLMLPPECLPKGRIVNLSVITGLDPAKLPGSGSRLCQIVKCGPEDILLRKPALLRIPHCGLLATDTPIVTVYGRQSQGDTIDWRVMNLAEGQCRVRNHYFELDIQKFGMISITIKDKTGIKKRMRALPLINRITSPTDDLIITLWLYNDDDVEHRCLLQGETLQHGKIQLAQHSSFTLKPERSPMSAQISIPTRDMTTVEDADTQDIDPEHLWTHTHHKVEFHLKNGGRDGNIVLNVSTKSRMRRTPFCTLKINIEIEKLLSPSSDGGHLSLRHQTPTAMVRSFDDVKRHLASKIDKETAVQIAAVLGLPADMKSSIRGSKTPGVLLLDKLVEKTKISAVRVSPLEGALMKNGDVEEAELIQRYRKENVVVSGLSPDSSLA